MTIFAALYENGAGTDLRIARTLDGEIFDAYEMKETFQSPGHESGRTTIPPPTGGAWHHYVITQRIETPGGD
eukprot:3870010-Rhodomonas_salina.1